MIRRHRPNFTWEGVDVHPYKEDGTHFKSVSRQTVFKGEGDFPVECRYFEVLSGGHSTLERHQHQHLVMVLRGSGQVLIGDTVHELHTNDVVHIPPFTWHQFRATGEEPLGFWCVVRSERDRPERPETTDGLSEKAAEFARL